MNTMCTIQSLFLQKESKCKFVSVIWTNSSGNNFRHCPGFQFLHVTSFLGNIGLWQGLYFALFGIWFVLHCSGVTPAGYHSSSIFSYISRLDGVYYLLKFSQFFLFFSFFSYKQKEERCLLFVHSPPSRYDCYHQVKLVTYTLLGCCSSNFLPLHSCCCHRCYSCLLFQG